MANKAKSKKKNPTDRPSPYMPGKLRRPRVSPPSSLERRRVRGPYDLSLP